MCVVLAFGHVFLYVCTGFSHSVPYLVCICFSMSQIQRTPKPLLSALVRCLHLLGITGEGGAAAGISNAVSVHPLSGSGDGVAASGDAGTTNAAVDQREAGRVWEGPWSSADRAVMATLALPVKAEMAALRRVATLTLAVEVATALRWVAWLFY